MNRQQLQIWLSICQGHTLQETADALGLKQPTVSFHLNKLEQRLGLELVHKHARKLRPTEAAHEMLPYVRRIVALMDELDDDARERREGGRGKLRLGASYTPATYWLPPIFADFQRQHPGVQLVLAVKNADRILRQLRQYEVDAAIVSLPLQPEDGLDIQPLESDALQLIIAPGHALAAKRELAVDDLRQETFLMHEPASTSRRLTEQWARQVGLRFGSTLELGAIETMKEAVKCHMGVAVLPRRSVTREVRAGELIQLDLPEYINLRHICFVTREELLLSANVRLFRQFVLEQAGAEANKEHSDGGRAN